MENLIIAALAAAFVVSVVDYWIDLKVFRVVISLTAATLALMSVSPPGGGYWWVAPSFAAAFLGIAVIQVMERVSRVTVQTGRR